MIRRRTDRDTDILARRLERASTTIPEVIDHLNEQRANTTILSTPTGGGGSKGGHSDPTLRTVTELAGVDHHLTAIRDQIHCVKVAINLLELACRDALGHKAPQRMSENEPTCQRPEINGQPCGQLVSYRIGEAGQIRYDANGLCDDHIRQDADDQRRADAANRQRQRRYAT